ncbi:single-stranded-DNA-specific exonuclease RecJ [Kordia sp. YSTF-M3]|uniref:Single-stranded-DNA-specific exonuclease RecJ n=1 Tax=Kordia aestuariivivens TaxID=2759037 RepID=A0ABR7QEM6_9FLAO|nr:single-stranded-DNA-specific exonuclease RecJ [Kordia aestuariivivens]MBC8757015.1 single-stranded-DNA-specific exonuclease RecJ [Kordia aestuariivivens]
MRWTLKPKPEAHKLKHLMEALQVNETVATLLLQRGIETYEAAKTFFRPSLDDIHDPFLMKDMNLAVARIDKAIADGENIMVYGDYDVDGTTSVALVSSYLKTIYPNIASYIPDRYEEGYGLSFQGIDFAEDNDISLIITLDCGIKAIDKVAYASEKNIDIIICDHHRPGTELPKAVAVLDPKRDDCNYPYDELCGCGVGFKLIQALSSKRGQTIEDLFPYLDLVATAIAADIVPLTGENRTLAHFGMQVINSAPRAGIKAIIDQLKKTSLTITDVVFVVAPRINAAGRISQGLHAVTLLTEDDLEVAKQYAASIETYNTERRALDQEITKEAFEQIEKLEEQERFTTVVYNENWHKGVIGIVASRLIETYYRPTLVFTKSGDKIAASARSVKGFDVYNALEQCKEHLIQFGGHKYAAGLTMKEEKYQDFKDAFEEVVKNTIDKNLLTPEILIDTKITLKEITPKFYRILKQFSPFGPQNMSPVFMSTQLQDNGWAKCVGAEKDHLKLNAVQQRSNPIAGIGFNLGDKLSTVKNKKPFDAVYSVDENEWNGNVTLQLRLRDIK